MFDAKNKMTKMLFKRPVITLLLIYIFIIIALNYAGFFSAEYNSFLIYNVNQKIVNITGKVSDEPVIKNGRQQFVLSVDTINGINIKKEKTLVSAPEAYNIKYGDIVYLSGKLSRIEKPVFPHIFDYNLYLQRQNIYTKFYLYNFELIGKQPNKIKQLSVKIRNDIEKKFDNYFKIPYSSILKSMVAGNKSFLDKKIKDDFINTGLIHILVISGLHIGFCAIVFIFVFRIIGLRLKYVYLLTIPFLFFYTLMTGANPPAVRASIMASCLLLALVLEREPLIYNALALSALIILILNPQTLFTASFQLSFAATLGIIYLFPKFIFAFGKINNSFYKNFRDIVCVTLSAQIALIPILIFYFGKLSVVSLFLNILIVPLTGFVICLSFAFYLFTFIYSYAAYGVSVILSVLLSLVFSAIQFGSNLSFSFVYVAIPSLPEIFFYYIVIFLMLEFKKNVKVLILIFLFIALMIINPFKKDEFCKIFISSKNITMHIKKAKNKNIIIFNELKKDQYYFNNLEQYLLALSVYKIDKLYIKNDNSDIKKKFTKVSVSEIIFPKK